MLQEENENLLDKVHNYSASHPLSLGFLFHQKTSVYLCLTAICIVTIPKFIVQLRLEEERCKEVEARVRELEKQVLLCFSEL